MGLGHLKEDLREIGAFPLLMLGVLGFSILFTYEIARPTVEALYQDVYGSENEPWAWLGVAFAVTLVVGLYSKEAGKRPLQQLLPRVLLVSALTLGVLLTGLHQGIESSSFLLYLWKDIYIVVLVELFWSIANSVFPTNAAKWLYGLFSCIGGIGAFAGGRCAKWLSENQVGLEESLWVVAIILIGSIAFAPFVPHARHTNPTKQAPDFLAGLRVVKASRYLGYLVAIIALSQLAITAIDYDFKIAIQAAYPDKLMRQGALADVYSIINVLALVLGFASGAILQAIGTKKTLIGVPLVLAACVGTFLVFPAYGIMMAAKIASKSMDYSIFRTAKELLYLPLSIAEKTQGKAIVDILTYRVAKGAASAILLIMKEMVTAPRVASAFALILTFIWILATIPALKRYVEKENTS